MCWYHTTASQDRLSTPVEVAEKSYRPEAQLSPSPHDRHTNVKQGGVSQIWIPGKINTRHTSHSLMLSYPSWPPVVGKILINRSSSVIGQDVTEGSSPLCFTTIKHFE